VFILGPSHHVSMDGCALTQTKIYETPLYDLTVDQEGINNEKFLYSFYAFHLFIILYSVVFG